MVVLPKISQTDILRLVLFLTAIPCVYGVIQYPGLRWFLIALFLITGIVARASLILAYLSFVFLFPLFPSQPQQWGLPAFDFYEFLFVTVAFWWAFFRLRRKEKISVPSIAGDALFFLGFCVLSAVLSIARDHVVSSEIFVLKLKDFVFFQGSPPRNDFSSLYLLKIFAEGILFFFITFDVLRNRSPISAIRMLFFSACLVALLGVFQYTAKFHLLKHWLDENPFLTRINSTLSDPNELGSFLGANFFLGIVNLFLTKGRARTFFVLGTILLLTATVLTASRAALAGVALGLFILPVILKSLGFDFSELFGARTKWVMRSGVAFIIAILLLASFLAFLNYKMDRPRNILEVIATTLNPRQPLNDTLKGRINLWSGAINIFSQNPLEGTGLGRFPSVFTKNYGEFFKGSENAHNYFLQLLAEIGLIGFTLFLIIIGKTILFGARSTERASNIIACRFGLLSAILVFLLTCFTGHPLLLLKMQIFFWALMGILWASLGGESFKRTKHCPRAGLVFAFGVLVIVLHLGFSKLSKPTPYEYGFYDWENDRVVGKFRWTRGDATSLMEREARLIAFSIRQPDQKSLRPLNTEIYLNEQLLDVVTLNHAEWLNLEYVLPEKMDAPVLLKFKPAKTYRPRLEGSSDPRTFGIAITPFRWTCFPSTDNGFYETEEEDGQKFRWTRKEAVMLLQPKAHEVHIPIAPGPLVAQAPVQVSFFWNGNPLKTVEFSELGWKRIHIQFPSGASQGILSLAVSRTWNPYRDGFSNDDRELGVKIGSLEWSGSSLEQNVARDVKRELLNNRRILGFFYLHESYSRVAFYPTVFPFTDSDLQKKPPLLYRADHAVKRSVGLMGSWNFPHKKEQVIPVLEKNQFLSGDTPLVRTFRAHAGPFVMRMNAWGGFAGDAFPLAKIRVNGDVIAIQPISSDSFMDYLFEFQSRDGLNEVAVQFINDFVDKAQDLDRNMSVKRIYVWRKQQNVSEEGWDAIPEGAARILQTQDYPILLTGTGAQIERQFFRKRGLASIVITARADLAGPEEPRLSVYVDNLWVGTINIDSNQFSTYKLDHLSLISGFSTLKLVFENDFFDSRTGMDRNIAVRAVDVKYGSGFLVTEPVEKMSPIREYCYTADYQSSVTTQK